MGPAICTECTRVFVPHELPRHAHEHECPQCRRNHIGQSRFAPGSGLVVTTASEFTSSREHLALRAPGHSGGDHR